MKLFLIRHGQSQSNTDLSIHKHIPDHAIELTEQGKKQAKISAEFLSNYVSNIGPEQTRLWNSPYLRARQTSDIFHKIFEKNWFNIEQKENILLCEQQFGLFDGLSNQELQQEYPAEHAHYALCEKFQGRFWARMPLGESRFDVATRVHQIFGTWKRDQEKHNINNLFVVAHGTTIRAILMQWLHKSPEWFEQEPNPGNCSIRMIEDHHDGGYIFEGFDHKGNLK